MAEAKGSVGNGAIKNESRFPAAITELFRLYAHDTSETANIAAINVIEDTFGAESAALFYITGDRVFRVCLGGTSFPVALPEPRWRACVGMHRPYENVCRFGPWTVPVLEKSLASWISVCLYLSGDEGSYIFLGRGEDPWTDHEADELSYLQMSISQIAELRHERGNEERRRKEAERLLARNESRLRDLFEGTPDMIYTADMEDVLTSVNRSAVSLLGYGSKEELVGKPFSSLALNPADRSLFLSRLARDGYVADYEIILKRKDETPLFCLETAHAVKEPSGTVRELQGMVKDITGRIENEKKQWRMNLELAEANLKLKQTQAVMVQQEKLASIGQLAAGVAHEINNPLGFLISNHAMLRKYFEKIKAAWPALPRPGGDPSAGSGDAAPLRRAFEDIESIFGESQDGFNRIVRIVSGLKDFSRVSSAGDFEDFDLNSGIESTLVVAWNEIKYVSDIRKKFGPVPLIRANGSEINQVILNILVNAAQAMTASAHSEKGVIEIVTYCEEDRAYVSISDNGPGIPETIINKIFDPFFTTKEPGKGTGLGLSISYDIIVHKHGGTIWVDSQAGEGTTFHISLPVKGPALKPGN